MDAANPRDSAGRLRGRSISLRVKRNCGQHLRGTLLRECAWWASAVLTHKMPALPENVQKAVFLNNTFQTQTQLTGPTHPANSPKILKGKLIPPWGLHTSSGPH